MPLEKIKIHEYKYKQSRIGQTEIRAKALGGKSAGLGHCRKVKNTFCQSSGMGSGPKASEVLRRRERKIFQKESRDKSAWLSELKGATRTERSKETLGLSPFPNNARNTYSKKGNKTLQGA